MSQHLATTDPDSDAIAACRRARSDVAAAGDRLRRVHEAGVRLNDVKRRPGVRTSSTGLTRLQAVISAAGISRQTANTWRKVGTVPSAFVERYIDDREPKGWEITIGGLLALWEPKPEPEPSYYIRLARLSDAAYQRFMHEVAVLGSTVFHTATPGETVVAVVERLYEDVLRQRTLTMSNPSVAQPSTHEAVTECEHTHPHQTREEGSLCER